MTLRLYRAVSAWPPTLDDFLSDAAKGKTPRDVQIECPELYQGISLFDSPDRISQRRRQGIRLPALTVEVVIPDNATVLRTLSRGHYTVIAPADDLLEAVVRLVE